MSDPKTFLPRLKATFSRQSEAQFSGTLSRRDQDLVSFTAEVSSPDLVTLQQQSQAAADAEPINLANWEKNLSADQQRVIREIVRQSLRSLGEDLDWVPLASVLNGQSVLDLNIRMILTEVDEEVIREEAEFLRIVDEVKGGHLDFDFDTATVRGQISAATDQDDSGSEEVQAAVG